jgi:hypothetical protein
MADRLMTRPTSKNIYTCRMALSFFAMGEGRRSEISQCETGKNSSRYRQCRLRIPNDMTTTANPAKNFRGSDYQIRP